MNRTINLENKQVKNHIIGYHFNTNLLTMETYFISAIQFHTA